MEKNGRLGPLRPNQNGLRFAKECDAAQTAAEYREKDRKFESRLKNLLNQRLAGGGGSLERTRLYAQIPC